MRKEGRGEERNTTMHLIKIQILPMPVVLLTLACMNFVCTGSYSRFHSLWGLYDPSVSSSPPKLPRSPAETKWKCLTRLTKFEYSATAVGQVEA